MPIQITPDELRSNYQYKVSVRILKQQFPWIKEISFKDDEVNKYGLIFLDILMDPDILSEETGWQLTSYAKYDVDKYGDYKSPYLSTVMQVTYEQAKEVTEQMEKVLDSVDKSPAIPQDLKLPTGRRLAIGSFLIKQEPKPSFDEKEHYLKPEDLPNI